MTRLLGIRSLSVRILLMNFGDATTTGEGRIVGAIMKTHVTLFVGFLASAASGLSPQQTTADELSAVVTQGAK